MSERELFIVKNILSKMVYNKMLNRFQVLPEVYIPLKLRQKQLELLEQMCINNDIDLVKLPKRLSKEETIKLLEKYRKLKDDFKFNPNHFIEMEMYNIRNAIAEGHMETVLTVILRYFPNILERTDREDIYQTGYEVMLGFIDWFDLEKSNYFTRYIYKYLIPFIHRKIAFISNDLTVEDDNRLVTMIRRRGLFNSLYNREPTNEELGKILNISLEEVEQLLLLEKIINETYSYEEQLESLEEGKDSNLLVDDSFEDYMMENLDGGYVRRIIDTLPTMQRKCVLLYFGFIDNKCYTYEDISSFLNISHQSARVCTIRGLKNLEKSIRGKILEKIYNNYDIQFEENETYTKKDNEFLVYYLIKQIPKDVLLEYIGSLNQKNQEILLLYFGLFDGREYSRKEICKKLGISYVNINERMRNAIDKLTLIIDLAFKIKYKETDRVNYSFLQNMMLDYINQNIKKQR